MFSLQTLLDLDHRPAPYETGVEFWNDPYISGQLLKAHLDPATDQASYKPETMRAICAFLPEAMGLPAGAAIADLGCGPGLYCAALSQAGYQMIGVDRSENSLRYAAQHAPRACFLRQSYLEPLGTARFDAAIMISQDYGVLRPGDRRVLLHNLRTALKPGGRFAFDVPSLRAFEARAAGNASRWYAADGGLFRPHPHLVLEKAFAYADIPATCDTYAVLDAQATVYRFWQTYFSPDSIRKELLENGFETADILSGLTGTEYTEDSQTVGVIAVRAQA